MDVYSKGGIGVQRDKHPVDVGEEVYNGVLSADEAAEKYRLSVHTVYLYVTLYKKKAGLTCRSSIKTEYKDLKEDELRRELMRKDIEIERLKKGYAVKGVGANKEFVTIKDVNTK